MMPHRDDLDILARTTDLLLEVCEPAELAQRFLRHGTEVFEAEAGFFLLRPGEAAPSLSVLGLEAEEAHRLAGELRGLLAEAGGSCGAWPAALAALATAGAAEGMLALFSSREGAFRDAGDRLLAGIMTRHAAAAVGRAGIHEEHRRQVERLAVQAEELERVRHALEGHSREVERSLAMRGRFFAAMSHELRTPINAILGYTELLGHGVFGALNGPQAEAAAKVGNSARQLLELVNDVLDFARIEAGRMPVRREPIDLPALAAEAAASLEVQARSKGLDLRVECATPLPPLESDPAKVRQILLNLLSNAVKFTQRGAVCVDVRHLRERGESASTPPPGCAPGGEGWIGIAVRDTGIGIPDEQIETIFGEFIQLGQPGQDSPGTGLGLAISTRLARLLGGELTVDSEVGLRSTFTLFLPCPAPALEDASSRG